MHKLRVFLVFGGKSTEHEVSLTSAKAIFEALDTTKYDVSCIGITKTGAWIGGNKAQQHLLSTAPARTPIIEKGVSENLLDFLPPDVHTKSLTNDVCPPYIIIPVLHGRFGEDGIIQGLFELEGAPYVGCGVLSSALGMDKVKQKEIAKQYGIPVTPWYAFSSRTWLTEKKRIIKEIIAAFHDTYPLFVKPGNTGSSIGVIKIHTKKELVAGIEKARTYDLKVIVEKGIVGGREIEVSCMGNDTVETSVCGEVVSANEFYDYDAKYANNKTKIIIPAPIPEKTSRIIRDMAKRAYKAGDCSGLARADFFLCKNGDILFNEINTMPGFTNMSMYPKLWEASGISFSVLLDRLIALGIERWRDRMAIVTEKGSTV